MVERNEVMERNQLLWLGGLSRVRPAQLTGCGGLLLVPVSLGDSLIGSGVGGL